MNERINELFEQALDQSVPETWTTLNPAQLSKLKAKLAELIIKEYEQFLPEICPWANADEEGPMKGWHVQFVARKHFGLEE